MITLLRYFDLFSQSIQFNGIILNQKQTRFGVFTSIIIFASTLFYSVYLAKLYFRNQIDPKFRSQNFIQNEDVEIPLSNQFFGFQIAPQFNHDLIMQQEKHNKTLIVFMAIFFSEIAVIMGIRYLMLQSVKVYNQMAIIVQAIQMLLIQKTDIYQNFVPDNCADLIEIYSYLANTQNTWNFRMKLSQFNTTSKEITSVKEGVFIQQKNSFSSPISVQFGSSSIDYQKYVKETGQKTVSLTVVDVDESVQYFYIEYPPYTEILALCNSFFALLMLLGVICRAIAQRFIKQDIFLLILQNSYFETYQKILQNSNLAQFKEDIQINQIDQCFLTEENEEVENNQQISIPQFKHLNSQSVSRKGQSYDQKQNAIEQQNLLLQDNQTSISNVILQPFQEFSQDFTKSNRYSPPLKSFQSEKLKKDNSYQSLNKQMMEKIEQQVFDNLDFYKLFEEIYF
ncbi:hypothetical protein ABPG72_015965 [Tetrahymena utriculariae]